MSLDSVGKLVAQHSSSPVEVQIKLTKAELEQVIVRNMFNWLVWGMILFGIGVVILIINKNFDLGRWFSLLALFFILSGAGVATAGVLNAIKRGTGISLRQPDLKSLPTKPIPAELPSITERTTQLIGVDDAPTNKMMDSKPRE